MRTTGASAVHMAKDDLLNAPVFVLDRDPIRLESTLDVLSSFPLESFRTATALLIKTVIIKPVALLVDLEYSLECGIVSSGYLRNLANNGVIIMYITADESTVKDPVWGNTKHPEYTIHRNATNRITELLTMAYSRRMTNQPNVDEPQVE